MTEPIIDSARFRQVLGHFPTGVCIVASVHDDHPVGLAIGSFFSLSLDPALVGFCAARTSSTWPKVREAGRFCVNVLGDDQEHVSRVFATRDADKFAQIAWEPTASGQPKIDGSVAWIDCNLDAVHDGGDHEIAIGAVQDLGVESESNPLVFFRGGYHNLA